ncbi:MAG: hypothetical protein HQ523_12575 [Lentisphaerae bacterium]|nr:hypothetical protein [Lentisphaerota bacterium]
MADISLKQQAVPLTLLALLLLVAAITAVGDQRLKRERRSFSIDRFERLMHRIDVAVSSISDTMIGEGMAADFEELLSRSTVESTTDIFVADVPEGRIVLELTGIVWNPREPLAFVNGLTVGKGDHVGAAEIISIAKESVSVRYPDKSEETLTLIRDNE